MPGGDLSGIIRSLAGPLELEARRGYPDAAVIGRSIGAYARDWAARARGVLGEAGAECCESICRALADYAKSDADGRERAAAEALRLLAGMNGGAAPLGTALAPSREPADERRPAKGAVGASAVRRKPADGRQATRPVDFNLDEPLLAGRKPQPAWVERLANIGVQTSRDLLYHFPRDYVAFKRIGDLVDGERAAVEVEAVTREAGVVREGRGFRLMRWALEVSDSTGRAWVTSFARVPRRGRQAAIIASSPLSLNYEPGTKLLIEGTVRRAGKFVEIQFIGSERLAGAAQFGPGALIPVYPLTDGVYQGQVRPVVRRLLEALPESLPDPLPKSLRERYDLLPLRQALRAIHTPESTEVKDAGLRRLAFEELLTLQVALAQRKREQQQPGTGIQMRPKGDVVAILEEILPFSFTKAQQRVIAEISADMGSDLPMYRLLQGDVGSGKTVVAAAALMIAIQNGYQGALMAPTELLAEQHYLVLSRLLDAVGVRVELLTGSMRAQDRQQANERIAEGRAQVVIGTHALIQEGVEFHQLGLVIVDEQHRFGVRQRAQLRSKGAQPDTLVMTATPIPRTLALTLYGDLEISVLDEMPPGRQPVKTWWVSLSHQDEAYDFVRKQTGEGRQVYVVCPLIEESENLQAEAATQLAEKLSKEIYPELRVGLLHGGMKVAEKGAVMEAFRAGQLDILTATTVIEVGVDVPNATVMLVLNAERFGLAQLHQLRGRVGRGAHESHCILMSDRRHDPTGRIAPKTDESLETTRRRLRVLIEESDGFRIAEEDLALRGPGEFYGTRQHGLPDFRLARMAREMGVLEQARDAAFWLVDTDPRLESPEHATLRDQVSALRARMDSAAA